ncbi:XdhC family protein [Parapedobacter tibetensis]|uniref:XdhC family protein n=1 Tax=Parapedobacter tibetensis TaxID=2972951 RepID=UPI00214DE026|nr:XdhC family protein [Parapedobacter tibetensis]
MKEIRQIIHAFEAARDQQKKAALATVVHIEGSSYRGPGARMLIMEDGTLTGAISGGCLEGDTLRKAMRVMMEEKPLLVTYDTSDEDDPVLGIGLGCNGIIRILIEPISSRNETTAISLLQRTLEKRQPSVLVTYFALDDKKHAEQGTKILVNADGVITADTHLPIPYQQIDPDIRRILAGKGSAFVQYPSGGQEGSTITAFIEYMEPALSLVIAGAGNDVLPLAQLAELLGWDLTLVDGRPSYANQVRFPNCQVIVSDPLHGLRQVAIDERTAVVLMSHNYDYDKAILSQVINSPASYIGMLGPKRKRDQMFRELTDDGLIIAEAQQLKLYGPTGLAIGAETPEEIALSIIAEIKAVFAGKKGEHLRDQTGGIHQRQTKIVPSLQAYGILILAAGQSKRLGKPKQQLVYKGNTLLQHAVKAAAMVGTAATVVVLGAQAEVLMKELDGTNVDCIQNEDYQEGMASSIRKGIQYLTGKYPKIENILVMLCDQPYVDTAHLIALINKQQSTGASITASYYAGRKGVPALFHQSVFSQLLELRGDIGAKQVIEQMGDEVAVVPFPLGAVDIDTKEAYHQTMELDIPKYTAP